MPEKKSAENIGKENPPTAEKQAIANAHKQAELDIENDADLNSKQEAGDDLDEGELAQLEGEDK